MNFKDIISEILKSDEIKKEDIFSALAPTPSLDKGDVCLPCFKFAKILRKSPQAIAGELKEKIDSSSQPLIGKTAVEGGYLNIFFNRAFAVKEMVTAFSQNGGVGPLGRSFPKKEKPAQTGGNFRGRHRGRGRQPAGYSG